MYPEPCFINEVVIYDLFEVINYNLFEDVNYDCNSNLGVFHKIGHKL